MSVVTKPIALDETAQTMNTKLQAIADALTPNAGGVSYSNATSGLSAETVQEAIDEVDGNVDSLNTSLTQYVKLKKSTILGTNAPSGSDISSYLTVDSGYVYLATCQILGVGFVPTFPIFLDEDTKKIWYTGTVPSGSSLKVCYLEVKNV